MIQQFNLRVNAIQAKTALEKLVDNPVLQTLDYQPDVTVSDALQAIRELLNYLQENRLQLPRNIEALINE
jgi:hypothetical protein